MVTRQVPCECVTRTAGVQRVKSIRRKEYRIGPNAEGKQVLVANPSKLSRSRHCCLSDQVIGQLEEIKNTLQEFYAGPMDVEFVVEGSHVWLVQARPVTGLERKNPSYLDLSFCDEEDLHWGEMLASGSSAVASVLASEQTIFATNVSRALEAYLHTKQKEKICAVFVEQGGENLSHFISVFQSLRIPVIAMPNAMVLREKKSLILCPQQGVVQVGGMVSKKDGWYSHPASGALSLEHPRYSDKTEARAFFEMLRYEKVNDISIDEATQDLKSSNPAVVKKAVATLLDHFRRFIGGPLRQRNDHLKQRIKTLAAQTLSLGREVWDHANAGKQMEQLFAVKMVQARMKTVPEGHDLIDGEGFNTLAGECQLQIKAAKELGAVVKHPQYGEYIFELHKVGRLILSESTRVNWVQLVKEIFHRGNPEECDVLIGLIHWLGKRNLIEIYMNTVFPELLKQSTSSKQLLRKVVKALKADTEALDWCQTQRQGLESMSLQIERFGKLDDGEFHSAFTQFKSKVIDPMLDGFKAERFIQSGMLGRLTLIQTYHRCMDVCDQALKSLVDSSGFRQRSQQKKRFMSLFRPLFELQFQMSGLLNEASQDALVKDRNLGLGVSVEKFLGQVREKFQAAQESKKENSLVASPGFSVAKSMIGSASVLLPFRMTLVDLWTLAHQNLITLFSVLRKQTSPLDFNIATSELGPLLKTLQSIPVTDDGDSSRVINLVHSELAHPWLRFRFNIPMNHHSATLDLHYRKDKGRVELHFKGYGHHLSLRWTRALTLAHLGVHAIEGLRFVRGREPRIDETRDVHTFAWCFDLPSDPQNCSGMANALSQVLKRIIYCCYPRTNDTRFVSAE